jgi:hypothetical protein
MTTKFELGENVSVCGEIVRIVANKTDGLMYCVSIPVESQEHYELYVKEENIRQK